MGWEVIISVNSASVVVTIPLPDGTWQSRPSKANPRFTKWVARIETKNDVNPEGKAPIFNPISTGIFSKWFTPSRAQAIPSKGQRLGRNCLEAKLFEYFEDARAIYVVTELCTGGNIGELDAQVTMDGGIWGWVLGWEMLGIWVFFVVPSAFCGKFLRRARMNL